MTLRPDEMRAEVARIANDTAASANERLEQTVDVLRRGGIDLPTELLTWASSPMLQRAAEPLADPDWMQDGPASPIMAIPHAEHDRMLAAERAKRGKPERRCSVVGCSCTKRHGGVAATPEKRAALVRPVYLDAASYHSRVSRYDRDAKTLTFLGQALARIIPSSATCDLAVIQAGLAKMGSVTAHRLFRWEVFTAHDRHVARVPYANILRSPAGLVEA